MIRIAIGGAFAIVLCATAAHAETQAEIAARDNEEGKELMFAGKYAEASAKFQQACARGPEAKYFFNLCTSLYQQGNYGEALTACNSGDKLNPDDKLKAKISKLEDKIHEEADRQHLNLTMVGGGGGETNVTPPPDPNTTSGNGGTTTTSGGTTTTTTGGNTTAPGNTGTTAVGTPPANPAFAVGRPPTVGVFQTQTPTHAYTWTLGIDFFGGGAGVGQKDVYASSGGGVRFKADYMMIPAARVGMQGYLQYTSIGKGDRPLTFTEGLDIADVGIALYKHLCPGRARFCFTPLGGIQLALMDPATISGSGSNNFNYAALGFRGELAASYAFGSRYEFVLQAMLGINFYTRAFSAPADMMTSDVGLDRGGGAPYVGFGFTYRFSTPFGQAPFVTLE